MTDTKTNPIQIVLIDDHSIMRAALRLLIERHPRMTVVGEASNRAEALKIVRRTRPAIILLDLDLDGESGVDLLPDLRKVASGARVIVLTGIRDAGGYRQAVELGARGLVLKEQDFDTLVQAIEHVYAGDDWLEPELVARVLAERPQARDSEQQTAPEATNSTRLAAHMLGSH